MADGHPAYEKWTPRRVVQVEIDGTVDENAKLAAVDAFGRQRISSHFTLFDTKLTHTAEPEFWDDQEVSGSGTATAHDPDTASSEISVSATTAGKRVRQTYTRPNYQPGKSQLVMMTGIVGAGATGLTCELGSFDDENGLFFSQKDGVMSVVRRTFVTGSAVDNKVAQTEWNLDKMDGSGPSGVTIDWSKTQIFVIDFEWLGVGKVRWGLGYDGGVIYVHEQDHVNHMDEVYMSNPNNPLRFSIENDGTGPAGTMKTICTMVASEGGQDENGVDYWYSTNGTHVDADAANSIYAVLGVRLQTGHKGEPVKIHDVSVLTQTNDDFEWLLYRNPTVAGTFTYGNETTGPFQTARGATANTISAGDVIAGGFGHAGAVIGAEIHYEAGFGEAIDGTRDEFVLAVRPLSSNADIEGGISLHVAH